MAACASGALELASDGAGAIVNVPQTDVEKQSIGNCWAYVHTSWAESMHKAATGEDVDLSEAYLTYWSWFEQIRLSPEATAVNAGGTWRIANGLVRNYGVIQKKDFVRDEQAADGEPLSVRAMNAINESLQRGALAAPEARTNTALIRAELDRAWALTPEHRAMLRRAFGEGGMRTFADGAARDTAPIVRDVDFVVAYPQAPGSPAEKRSLGSAMSEWQTVRFGARDTSRSYWLRVQRALHANAPVLMAWLVDYNAFEREAGALRGSFSMSKLTSQGPGKQLVHVTVLADYQARLSDGTLLEAGITLDPAKSEDRVKLAQALESGTKVEFVRVKNSWGTTGDGSVHAPGMPGYHDVYLDYLEGPIARCAPSGDCATQEAPLRYVVLPPGF